MFSLASQAGDFELVTVPYIPVLADELTMAEDEVCQTQGKIALKALTNAQNKITLDAQLFVWDEFMKSYYANAYDESELSLHREIIVMAWDINEQYPDVTPEEYGEYVYGACAAEALDNPRVKI